MTARPRVVLADDYGPLLTALARLLESDYEVVGRAKTVAELLEVAKTCRPDIAIVDFSLPDANGIDACRQLKIIQPDIEIVILTAIDDASIRAAALEAGASDFVSKAMVHVRLLPAVRGLRSNVERNT